MKTIRLLVGLAALVTALWFAVGRSGSVAVKRLTEEVNRLEEEKTQLVEYAERLSASQRVAQVNILSQHEDEQGRTVTTIRWQEIASTGVLSEPLNLEVLGQQVYFEALVIKFDLSHVGGGDPGKSASVALFRRIFGDQQSPESVAELDRHVPSPAAVEDAAVHLSAALWDRFWEMVDDPALGAQYGVRVAQCEAPAVRVAPEQIWELTLDAAGGLNVRRLDRKGVVLTADPSGG